MPLLALANELLNAIIEFSDFSDARELCKTCHLLNTLATPYLYSTITLDEKSEVNSPESPCPYFFLRTIVNRPDLAKFPKTFKCVWLLRVDLEKIWRTFHRNLGDTNPAPDLWDLVLTKVNEASASKKQAKLWHTAIMGLRYSRAPGSDGVFAFIACLLPNLKEIQMSEGTFNRGGNAGSIDPTAKFFAPLFARAVALQIKQRASEHEISPYSMSNVTSMSIKNISHENVPLSKIVHRLELLSIKKFVVQDANDFFPATSFSIPETFTSRVEDLRFERSVLHAENFRKSWAPDHHFAGLMASKETLEFIEARVSKEYINYYLLDIVFVSRPCSFANFTESKEIVVSAGLVLYDRIGGITTKNTKTDHTGAFLQRIPRSLQKLTLKDCYYYNHEASAFFSKYNTNLIMASVEIDGNSAYGTSSSILNKYEGLFTAEMPPRSSCA
ncbi:hypothetical protein BOTCAL_0010g00590 [Botryotinia calthae]|uniref:Uncharacterized protein n=1 Tax=Botryotinia calthae TaxID=38488 RepID=A0A4Y8DGP0_9HELO|nr:hypothetical protein BOTCAL_0010g00590 [Botryotinia calthae]